MLLPDERKNTVIKQLSEERKYWLVMKNIWIVGVDTANNSIKYLDEKIKELEDAH